MIRLLKISRARIQLHLWLRKHPEQHKEEVMNEFNRLHILAAVTGSQTSEPWRLIYHKVFWDERAEWEKRADNQQR